MYNYFFFLRSQLDAANGELTFAEEKMKHLEEEKIKDEEDRKDETERMERLRAHNQKTITVSIIKIIQSIATDEALFDIPLLFNECG